MRNYQILAQMMLFGLEKLTKVIPHPTHPEISDNNHAHFWVFLLMVESRKSFILWIPRNIAVNVRFEMALLWISSTTVNAATINLAIAFK